MKDSAVSRAVVIYTNRGCAVKEALENNEISRLRYEDYLGCIRN